MFYADDLKIYHIIESIEDGIFFQDKFGQLLSWCRISKLELNVSKCFSITFTRKMSPIIGSYYLGSDESDELKRQDEIVDLGVIIDNGVTFYKHYDVTLGRVWVT